MPPKKLFAGFSDEELSEFSGYLDRMMANLEEELGEDAQVVLEQMREKRAQFLAMHGHGHGHGHGFHHGQGQPYSSR